MSERVTFTSTNGDAVGAALVQEWWGLNAQIEGDATEANTA